MQPPIPHRSTIPDKSFIDNLKDFHLEILAENHGLCSGPDGKNMIFWGRDARLQLVLMFRHIPPTDVRLDDLVARIAHLNFPFTQRTSERVYMTDVIELNSLEHGLNTDPTGISIFYKGRDGEVFLGTQGRLAIDTIPPMAPMNLRAIDSQSSYFLLTWEYEKDIKEYLVEKWDSGKWLTIRSGFRSPPVRIDSRPEGRVRIVAMDCALNRAISDEVWVEYITIKKKGCGKNRTAAYRNAQDMVNEQFVWQYVRPGLISCSDLNQREVDRMIARNPKGWVPPGIHFTPEDKAEYNSEGNEYCARVTGRLSRKTLQRWIRDRSGEINTQRRHGIRLRISGPGSDILEEYFRSGAGSRGYRVYKDKHFLPFESLYI
ncbi:MAG: fibronectin type III domain-containing protein, partial [Candidatus Aminicenantes bacterium]|nr:fibronectin type III domain-containing protein [Candidatus Aminicenantes bacterium]